MRNIENLDVFEILITQKNAKMPKGPFCQIRTHIFLSLKIVFIIANSKDPEKMLPYSAFHLIVFTVCQSTFTSIQNEKGQKQP